MPKSAQLLGRGFRGPRAPGVALAFLAVALCLSAWIVHSPLLPQQPTTTPLQLNGLPMDATLLLQYEQAISSSGPMLRQEPLFHLCALFTASFSA